jgi:L-aspartate oxidase
MLHFDYAVIGSGLAGLSFALKAARSGTVAIITKKAKAESNTAWAQGGIACVTDETDSIESHVQDTLNAGAGLCDEKVVRSIVRDGPRSIAELIAIGVVFDRQSDGRPDLTREGGHAARRILHSRDATGREIERALLEAVAKEPRITLRKLGLSAGEDRCVGAYVLNEATGAVLTLRTDRVLLATGGCGKVYRYTTNPSIATGDGVAMAWRAGAPVANMEFIQFHPTCLFHPDARSFLITEAMRRCQAGGCKRKGICPPLRSPRGAGPA